MFCLRILQEKFREYNSDLHMAFADAEEAYNTRVVRYGTALEGEMCINEAFIRTIQDM